MELVLQAFIVLLKFLVPSLMLVFPLIGVWANYLLDIVDGDILMTLGMNEYLYQTIDKSADLVSYVFMLILGMRWRVSKIIAILFVYRLIGQLAFFITRNELVFVLFQNLLEPFLLIYTVLVFKFRNDKDAYAFYKKHLIIIWSVVLIYKIWNEWYLHFANIDLSTIFFGFNGGK